MKIPEIQILNLLPPPHTVNTAWVKFESLVFDLAFEYVPHFSGEKRLDNHKALEKCRERVTGNPQERWARGYVVDMGSWSGFQSIDGIEGKVLVSPEMRKLQVEETKAMLDDLDVVREKFQNFDKFSFECRDHSVQTEILQ